MQGATANANGAAGIVPQPLAGDQNKFLRGDATWATVSEFTAADAARLSNVEGQIVTIIGSDPGLSMREVAAAQIATVVADAPAAFDTLKEIADWIEDHPTEADLTGINSRLTAVENGLATVQGDISSMEGDIVYINNAITNIEGDITNLQTQVTALDARLRWEELGEGE